MDGEKTLSAVFGGLGALCLAGAAWASMELEQGGMLDRAGVALTLLILAALALALLRLEGTGKSRLLMMLLPIGAAMLVRALCLDYTSGDYLSFLSDWYVYFRDNGGFSAIAADVGDYNAPYLYFMAAISYLSMPDLYAIKLFSILFDVLLAWGGFRLVRALRGRGEGDAVPLMAFAILMFLPTVVLNGAFWGQCDSIYGALVLHAAALVFQGRNKSSVALLAVAFSFKLQTVFLVPLWGVLWLARRVKFRELCVFPLAYFVTILPALLLGKPLGDILSVYFEQAGEYSRLTLSAPSVFQFIPYDLEVDAALASYLGILAAAGLVFLLFVLALWLGRRLDRETAMASAVVLAIGVPFLLPHMHERYFFLADLLTAVWACCDRRRLPAAVLVCGASLASYLVYLRLKYNFVLTVGGARFPMALEALSMLAALIYSVAVLALKIKECKGKIPERGEWR